MSAEIPIPFKLTGLTQKLTLGAASVQSAAFSAQTYAIRVSASGNCHVRYDGSNNPTATGNDTYLAANVVAEYWGVSPGTKIAVIQDASSTGNVSITELTR